MGRRSHHHSLRDSLYRGGQRLLHRFHLGARLDYFGGHVLCTQSGADRPLAAWDDDSLWLGEVGAARREWVAAGDAAKASSFARHWSQGHICFAADVGGLCAGYLWVALGPTRFRQTGEDWIVPAGSAWMFSAWGHPLFPGTYPALRCFASAQLKQWGCERFWGQVEFGNTTSLRVHRRLGASVLGWVFWLRAPGLRFQCRQAGRWPYVQLALRRARPEGFAIPLAAFRGGGSA